MKKNFNVEIDCAVCAAKCVDAIKKIEGVKDCDINFVTQKMMFEADDANFDELLKAAIKAAQKIEPDFECEA